MLKFQTTIEIVGVEILQELADCSVEERGSKNLDALKVKLKVLAGFE